jgi:2-C-methyl-D-erythritol 4-phosphate cytidylyltransferase / 2-C-methyl-D-erythritol 2,4-cyclodiphosphate synthase
MRLAGKAPLSRCEGMTQRAKTIGMIVAAGSGSRAGADVPKQFRMVQGKPLLRHSYEAFLAHPLVDQIILVIGGCQTAAVASALAGLPEPILVIGGITRRESVANGLEAAEDLGGAENILIHDAARPFLPQHVISDLIAALAVNAGAVPTLPVVDSLARGNTLMTETVERGGLRRIQTPQAFHFGAILAAHRGWDVTAEASDDARMAMAAGVDVALIEGDEALAKFTFANDFENETRQSMPIIMPTTMPMTLYRTGNGFDVHRLVAGAELWLCGVKIEHSHGLLGHSDADVALHAITDAMLGALALGDIGDHFPPSDPQWRGASSDQFAMHALKLASEAGYTLGNVDVTIICEAPKIGPHRDEMRLRLADILATDITNISVKATTTELLGFAGRGEGIAAQAIVSFYK